jgi:HEAT repeat protein
MFSISRRYKAFARLAGILCLATINCSNYRLNCIFFAAVYILAWRVETDVRRSAASTLRRIGPESKEAEPALITVLQDRREEVRISAAIALLHIVPEAKDIVPMLITAFKDQEATVRSAAAAALEKLGPGAREAVPALITAFQDPNKDVRIAAAYPLKKTDADNSYSLTHS